MNTIMVIDDDDQLRKSFEKLLSEEGYQKFFDGFPGPAMCGNCPTPFKKR